MNRGVGALVVKSGRRRKRVQWHSRCRCTVLETAMARSAHIASHGQNIISRVRARIALTAISTTKERRAIIFGRCRARRDDSDAAGKGGTGVVV